MIKRIIELSKGNKLELDMETKFVEHIAKYFNVQVSHLSNEQIKQYIWQRSRFECQSSAAE
jgi:hypothetical protein